jgi:DNA invertase Pin-like site-specific DNA recombinase
MAREKSQMTETAAAGVALYARYSSDLQNPRSIEDQLAHLQRYLKQRGGNPEHARSFVDAETSGGVWDRPGLQALLREVEANRIQQVFIEDVGRISRDGEDLARLRKLARFYGTRVVFIDDGFELDGSSGDLLHAFCLMSVHAVRDRRAGGGCVEVWGRGSIPDSRSAQP